MAEPWTAVSTEKGDINGTLSSVKALSAEFTADAAAATVPTLQVLSASNAGFLQRATVIFDGTTPPTGAEFTVQISDRDGVVIGNPDGTALTTSSNIAINAYFQGALYVSVSGNETNSAKAQVVLYVSA